MGARWGGVAGLRYAHVMARVNRLNQEKWHNRAALVAEFVRQRLRLPKPADGHIGAWLSGQRSALHAGLTSMTTERQIVLDQVAPGWREFLPPPTTWTWPERVEHLKRFLTAVDRWPSQTTDSEDERSLANWLSMQRTRAHQGGLADARCAVLDRNFPGWDTGSREDAWRSNANLLGAFVRGHQRWPSRRAASEEERKLGGWLHNRRQDVRTGTALTPDRADYLDEVATGWNGCSSLG